MGGLGNYTDPDRESLIRDQIKQSMRKINDKEYEYVLAYKNNLTEIVHTGTITFDSEDEGENYCHILNMNASNIVKGLGKYIIVKREKTDNNT